MRTLDRSLDTHLQIGHRGAPCDRAALTCLVRAEAALAQRLEFVSVLLDISKAYERIRHSVLRQTGRAKGLPEGFLRGLLAVYSTCKCVTFEGQAAAPESFPGISMIAGCSMAVMAMKIFMSPLVELLESLSPAVRPASLVDDVQWNIVGLPSEVAAITVQTIQAAKTWIVGRGLELSSGKNVVLASSVKVEKAVLAEVCDDFQGAVVSRYVGT
eukprot:3628799-Amphidinium_carterae.1